MSLKDLPPAAAAIAAAGLQANAHMLRTYGAPDAADTCQRHADELKERAAALTGAAPAIGPQRDAPSVPTTRHDCPDSRRIDVTELIAQSGDGLMIECGSEGTHTYRFVYRDPDDQHFVAGRWDATARATAEKRFPDLRAALDYCLNLRP